MSLYFCAQLWRHFKRKREMNGNIHLWTNSTPIFKVSCSVLLWEDDPKILVDFVTSTASSLAPSICFFDILSPWTYFSIPVSFLPSSLFLSVPFSPAVTLSVVFIPPSLTLLDPQAMASWLLHLSVSAENSPQSRLPCRARLSPFLPHSLGGGGECKQRSMSRWITSAFK